MVYVHLGHLKRKGEDVCIFNILPIAPNLSHLHEVIELEEEGSNLEGGGTVRLFQMVSNGFK